MKKLKNIDAILFDMIGVLLFRRKDYIPDQIIDEIDTLVGNVINDDSFKHEVLKKFRLIEKEFKNVLTKIVQKYELFTPLWEILPELKKYYKLAIINNGTALTLPQFKQKFNFDKYFDLFISSAKVGFKKPDDEIFLTTTKKLKIDPKRCLFMDDSKQNIKGAVNVGMQTIHWPNQVAGFKKFLEVINA
jgi:HAD superfamily hydrolase (TIGR01509 family)